MVMFLLSFVKGVQIRGGESISASGSLRVQGTESLTQTPDG